MVPGERITDQQVDQYKEHCRRFSQPMRDAAVVPMSAGAPALMAVSIHEEPQQRRTSEYFHVAAAARVPSVRTCRRRAESNGRWRLLAALPQPVRLRLLWLALRAPGVSRRSAPGCRKRCR